MATEDVDRYEEVDSRYERADDPTGNQNEGAGQQKLERIAERKAERNGETGRAPADQKHREQMRQAMDGARHEPIARGVRIGKQPERQEHGDDPKRGDLGAER